MSEWTATLCENTAPHPPHQLMEYTGEDDTYDVWCIGITRGGAV